MKHVIRIILLTVFLVVTAAIWDGLFSTTLVKLLLNVDFIWPNSTIVLDFTYHLLTTTVIYVIFISLPARYQKIYIASLFFITLFLYFILSTIAIQYFPITIWSLSGWIVIHLLFMMLLATYRKTYTHKK